MNTPKIHFSAHVQLQYLKAKHRVSDIGLTIEMATYYSNEAFSLKKTKHGKITAIQVLEGKTAPPIRKPLPKPQSKRPFKKPSKTFGKPKAQNKHPASYQSQLAVPVVIKKKRTFVK
jgi:hypothetical protein